jgi:hypothetical protein
MTTGGGGRQGAWLMFVCAGDTRESALAGQNAHLLMSMMLATYAPPATPSHFTASVECWPLAAPLLEPPCDPCRLPGLCSWLMLLVLLLGQHSKLYTLPLCSLQSTLC